MIKTIVLSVLIIAISVALLCIKIIFLKGGKFTSQHIHEKAKMVTIEKNWQADQDKEARKRNKAF